MKLQINHVGQNGEGAFALAICIPWPRETQHYLAGTIGAKWTDPGGRAKCNHWPVESIAIKSTETAWPRET